MDLEKLKADYAELVGEFGEKGAAIVAGIPIKDITAALESETKYTKKLRAFIDSRNSGYASYSEEYQELLLKLEHFIAFSGSAGNAGKSLGKTGSTISNIRKGCYKGKVPEFFSEFKSYIDLKQEYAKTFKEVPYAPTGISENVYEAIRAVKIKGGCGIITGDPGVGKTKAIMKFAEDNPKSTIVITGSAFDTGTTAVLELLAEELGIDEDKPRRMKKAILSKLSDGMIIIVDEAQSFQFRAMDGLRAISDKFEKKGETLGIVFVGNHCLRDMFTGKNGDKHSQLWSRFYVKPKYYSEQIKLSDISLLFPILAQNNMIKELMFLHSIATTSREGTRTAVRLFGNAYDNNGEYTLDSLIAEAHNMDVEFKNLPQLIKKIKDGVA